ncbi:MAG: cellulase family glycosylhydrolase [Clostridia bacterium]|nr:cellulase family glycosylhydrolase [Clostridia bacterium]
MTVTEKMSRARVYGFLRAEGGKIVNGRGEEILLTGMGLGNWLLPEGYMWRFGGRYNSPRRIEALVRDLCGSRFAEDFWRQFRENYITEADVAAMAEAGFNSVRIPIGWRVMMEDEPGIAFREEGFALLDRFLDWCEKYRLYVCLDLHGAPGGQTGSNIDDCIDDIPRLLTDTQSDSREKTLALWCEFARRYRDRWIIGMYDLLNEPARCPIDGYPKLDHDALRLSLKQFYRDCIAEIRKIDAVHMFSIESDVWASRADFFDEVFDENMCLHFHRYWCPPRRFMYDAFLERRETLGIPLYLGETGENDPAWFAAMYPLAAELDIGYNIWPWKKLDTDNSPCSVVKPALWDKIIAYTDGGDRPSYADAQAAFAAYLENIRFENCRYQPDVVASIFRRPGCVIRACDTAEQNGAVTWVDRTTGEPTNEWEKTVTRFAAGASADYRRYADGETGVIRITPVSGSGCVQLSFDGTVLGTFDAAAGETVSAVLPAAHDGMLTVVCTGGTLDIEMIVYDRNREDV